MMKLNILHLVFLLIGSVFAAGPLTSGACKLEIYSRGFESWHDLTEGFLYGLHSNPAPTVNECFLCDRLGLAIGAIQIALVDLQVTRPDWITDAII